MSDLKEYVVTLASMEDSEDFYNDMETEGGSLFIPSRAVDCKDRRPISRNTHYLLTDEEASQVAKDPRVIAVELTPGQLGLKAGVFSIQQSSSYFDKSGNASSNFINWGLLRCSESGQNIIGWGSNGTQTVSGTISLSQIGRNVDIIVVDDDGAVPNHPEFAVNSDGTGGSRFVQYDWHRHNPEVLGSAETVSYAYGTSDHPIHVQGTCAGNRQGWARGANLYNIYYDLNGNNGSQGDFSRVFDYVRAFHRNKSVNPATGLKNPTICNNSWGWSIFPGQYSLTTISAVNYRGTRHLPSSAPQPSGFTGVCSASTKYADITGYINTGTRITTTGATSASTQGIASNLNGTTGLAPSTTPTSGDNDDGYWTITLPFSITYLGTSYSTCYVGTNGYLTFTAGSVAYSGISASIPAVPKICFLANDRSVQRIYYGVLGSSPNRTYVVRIEGHTSYSGGTLGSPTMVWEYTFYESTPNQIDLQAGVNGGVTAGYFTESEINQWGVLLSQRIPARLAGVDADLQDAIKDGIIMVGAAGNGEWYHDLPGGLDWNNTIEFSDLGTRYYHRGTSPTANDNITNGSYDLPNICVGSTDYSVGNPDKKAGFSDTGPGVDIWAPGYQIQSSWPPNNGGVADPRNASYYLSKLSGTSMASPQVTGVIACALENNPTWTQRDAKAYIQGVAKTGQLNLSSTGGYADPYDFNGATLLHLYYRQDRADVGPVFPKENISYRRPEKQVWPRKRIRYFGKSSFSDLSFSSANLTASRTNAQLGGRTDYTGTANTNSSVSIAWTVTSSTVSVVATGIPFHSYYNSAAANIPAVQNYSKSWMYRGGTNLGAASPPATGSGKIGLWINGISMFNPSAQGGSPGPGYATYANWHYNAAYEAGVELNYSFGEDNAGAHAAPPNEYHYHDGSMIITGAWLRGTGHTSGTYGATGLAECDVIPYLHSGLTSSDGHSKILGISADGYPVYGPYGYSTATNALSGVRRMVSGYALNPTFVSQGFRTLNGTTPPVNTTYPLGMFVEDWSYVGGGDLDTHNGRYCVTPEYPNGTYAYFLAFNSLMKPTYPYVIGNTYYNIPAVL
jgi:hypothetical protein